MRDTTVFDAVTVGEIAQYGRGPPAMPKANENGQKRVRACWEATPVSKTCLAGKADDSMNPTPRS